MSYCNLELIVVLFLGNHCIETSKKPPWQKRMELLQLLIISVGLAQPVMVLAFLFRRPTSEIYLTAYLPNPGSLWSMLLIALPFNLILIMATWSVLILFFVFITNFIYTIGAVLVELRYVKICPHPLKKIVDEI